MQDKRRQAGSGKVKNMIASFNRPSSSRQQKQKKQEADQRKLSNGVKQDRRRKNPGQTRGNRTDEQTRKEGKTQTYIHKDTKTGSGK